MKILILSYEFPPLVGGASTYARELAVGLSKNGCIVTIFTSYHGLREKNEQIDSNLLNSYGIEVHRQKSFSKLFFIQFHFNLIKSIGFTYSKKYDLIILSDVRAIRYSLLFMGKKDISKSVMVFHGGQVESFLTQPNIQSRIFRLDEKFRKMLFKCKVSIAVSDALRNSFIKIIPELKEYMFVVPHGIDIDLFRPISEDIIVLIRQRYGLERYHYVIISSSRLVEKKGQDYLLIAYSKLRSLYPNVRIIIAGDGSYRSQLEKLCTELNIRNEVKFAGQLDRKKLAQLIAASDLSVMLSRIPYEAFGIVNIEANACGVPVLSTNMAGVPDSIEDGITGLLVNPLDIDEIIHALKKLINKKYLKKLKENTVKKIYRNNTNIVMAQKTLELVNSTNPKI